MKSRLVALLLLAVAVLAAAPAQAQHHRQYRDERDYRSNRDYRQRQYHRGPAIWTGLHQWENEMRLNMAISSRDHNRSMCERHLARYGWDAVAQTRCPRGGIPYDSLSGGRDDSDSLGDLGYNRGYAKAMHEMEENRLPTAQHEHEVARGDRQDDSELWLNLTKCPMRVDDREVPAEGLRVTNPRTARVSVQSDTCTSTVRKPLGAGVFGIKCQ